LQFSPQLEEMERFSRQVIQASSRTLPRVVESSTLAQAV